MSLVEEAQERLVEVEHAHVAEALDEEAGVEQVEDGVLGAAGVLVDGGPLLHLCGVPGARVVVGAQEAQEVPGGVEEGVHGVGLAARLAAAGGAGGAGEALMAGQRRLARWLELSVLGQQHGQLVFGHRYGAAGVAVDHRDGCPSSAGGR